MLKKRIITCLDIKDGRTVKGTNFIHLKDAGDPVELALRYAEEGADELVFLDITATVEKRRTRIALVEKIARMITIPFTVGGGINSLDDAKDIINAGADKITLNSSAVRWPGLISQLAEQYGNQSVVVAIDTRSLSGEWKVFTHGGKIPTALNAEVWAKQVEALGAGEILLTSMDHDGVKKGFALAITEAIASAAGIPVIASGGAGSTAHFKDLFQQTQASGALAASVFHFGEVHIPSLKHDLKNLNINVR